MRDTHTDRALASERKCSACGAIDAGIDYACATCGYRDAPRERVGTITDAAERFRTNVAYVWVAIAHGHELWDGSGNYVLHADPEKREGTLWIVEAERV